MVRFKIALFVLCALCANPAHAGCGKGWITLEAPAEMSVSEFHQLIENEFGPLNMYARLQPNGGWDVYIPGLPFNNYILQPGDHVVGRMTACGGWVPGFSHLQLIADEPQLRLSVSGEEVEYVLLEGSLISVTNSILTSLGNNLYKVEPLPQNVQRPFHGEMLISATGEVKVVGGKTVHGWPIKIKPTFTN